MKSLGFGGVRSKLLNVENIDKYVEDNRIGNYALGYNRNHIFVPKYVGRSDNDLKERLMDHVNSNHKRFKFKYQRTKKQAFIKECENYHDLNDQIENEIHPDSPDGQSLECPMDCNEDYD